MRFEGIGCAGTLVSTSLVLTAAHCVCGSFAWFNQSCTNERATDLAKKKGWKVILGDHDRRAIGKGDIVIEIEEIIKHEKAYTHDTVQGRNKYNSCYQYAQTKHMLCSLFKTLSCNKIAL